MPASGQRISGMQSRIFGPGEVIFRQGDAGQREAYLVHDGKVEVRRGTPAGERVLRILAKATLLVVPADRLEYIVRTKPNLAIAIIRQLARMASTEDDRM